jgi:NTE family protein
MSASARPSEGRAPSLGEDVAQRQEGRSAKREPAQGPSVTLVIGSGGVKCAAAIGVAKALASAGIRIERAVGCSGGALFAATLALGFDAAKIADITVKTWTGEITSRRNIPGVLRLLAPRLFGFRADNFGLRDDRLILSTLRGVFGDRRVEDTPIPLHIAATDFMTGELVDITQGDLVQAIRASISMPLVFTPVKRDNRVLVDGYVSDPLPVGVAMKNGARVIVAVGFESPHVSNIRSAARFGAQLSTILANNLMRSRLAFQSAAHHSEIIMILPEFKQRVRLFDTSKVPYLIDEGEQATLKELPYLRKLLAADEGRRA